MIRWDEVLLLFQWLGIVLIGGFFTAAAMIAMIHALDVIFGAPKPWRRR